MYASNLEQLLFELMHTSDVSPSERPDFCVRFDSLRRYGRLPRGRENHATLLSDEQIANAILGMASNKPGWAGHAATVLAKLQPVGGMAASFKRSPTLSAALLMLLSDEPARGSLTAMTISSAETGVNSKGYARLVYKDNSEIRIANFVPTSALTLLQAGAEKAFNPDRRYAPITRELSFDQSFFDRLSRSAENIRTHKRGPISNGVEYDAEELEARRLSKLGVKQGSQYLTIGVDTQVTWPKEEILVQFDRYSLVLLPKQQRLHSVDMHRSGSE